MTHHQPIKLRPPKSAKKLRAVKNPPKKSNRGLILVIFLFIALGGGYYYYHEKQPHPVTKSSQTASQPAPKLKPEPNAPLVPISEKIEKSTAFTAGESGINTLRIPTIAVTNKGTILAMGEARVKTWKDRSYTNLVVKRSVDGGKTWSPLKDLTIAVNPANKEEYAFLDPGFIVEQTTNQIWVFAVRWRANSHDALHNSLWGMYSDDDGKTWSQPKDFTQNLLAGENFSIYGVNPGTGLQITEGKYKGRLLFILRQCCNDDQKSYLVTAYSDDQGTTWKIGKPARLSGESQIAYCGNNRLTLNIRGSGKRRVAFSNDGGINWSQAQDDPDLRAPERGCQASVLWGGGETVLFAGTAGVAPNKNGFDGRAQLRLFRSVDGAKNGSWQESIVLHPNAAGYTAMARMPDGRIALIFEAGNSPHGFITERSRPAGWMRLDVWILPKHYADAKIPLAMN